MAINLQHDINATDALINLIKVAEKDMQNGNVERSKKVFVELKRELVENA